MIRLFHRWLGLRKTWIEIYEDGKGIWMSMISFLKQHMIDPLSSIYQELFHNRYMTMDASVVEQSRDAVLRMVESLVSYPIPKNRETIALLQIYEKNIRHPWYSLAFGDLLQVLLIQLQKLKVDVEEQMLTLNQLVRSNEINFQLLAAIPGFLILYFGYHMLLSLFNAWRYQQIHGMGTPARQVKWWLLAIQQCYARLNESSQESSTFYQTYGTAYYYCYAIEWLRFFVIWSNCILLSVR
ncbi:Nuclear control of ATPase protein 2 [Galdieria sulphuraria]|nr:Nuclear control of ATPase protein 2 [Galdieria sulphuraria]